MLNVYLVDDEYFVRNSLHQNIPWTSNGFEVVGEANNGKTALEEIPLLCPDIAVVDINIPFYSGLELIELLQKKMIACRYIILSGYNEFKYAQTAIRLGVTDYILKPIDYPLLLNTLNGLKEAILSNNSLHQKISVLESEKKELLLEQYYNDCVTCNISAQRTLYYDKTIISKQELIPPYPAYQIAILKTVPPLLPTELKDLLPDPNVQKFIFCQDLKNRIFFILNGEAPAEITTLLEHLYEKLNNLMLSHSIGIGRPYLNFDQLYLSYNEAQIALKNHTLLPKALIYYEELNNSSDYMHVNLKMKHRLKACILDKNMEGTRQLLAQFYDSFVSSDTLFQRLVFNTVELIHILTDVLSNQLSMPVSVLQNSDNILDLLNNMNDVEEIKNWTIHIYDCAIHNFFSQSSAYSNVTLKIEDFIKQNYANPELTIPLIAESLFLNYSYLCSCFKRDLHLTINDYLNNLRIQKAVELFQSGVDNVGYVAEKTGFNNSGYFSKRFKKMVGLSPSEYIKTV